MGSGVGDGIGPAGGLVGQVLHGTYRIERPIGEGGMGAVYEASHLRLARRFAVKVLARSLADRPEILARFQREAEITSALGHPHIIDVIDFNQLPDGAPYILMELLQGHDLAFRIKRERRLSIGQVATIFGQAASALQAAHDKGVIHRDLKPENIFLCEVGQRGDYVKVLDFGISKMTGAETGLTKSRVIMGTPAYMAPEQAEEGAAGADPRTDIYAMGAILYEMLTGQPPLTGSSIPSLLYKVVHEQPEPLRALRPDAPAGLEQVLARAMSKKRDERFDSMMSFWAAFEHVVSQANIGYAEPTAEHKLWLEQSAAASIDPALAGAETEITPLPPVTLSQKVTTLSSSSGQMQTASVAKRRPPGKALVAAIAVTLLLASAVSLFFVFRGGPEQPRQVAGNRARAALDARPAASAMAPDAGVDQTVASVDQRTRAPNATRKLSLSSTPSRASVHLDGRLLGRTPVVETAVPTRALTLTINKRGFIVATLHLDQGEDPIARAVSLRRKTRPRKVRASPQHKPAKPATPKKPDTPRQPKGRKGWIRQPTFE